MENARSADARKKVLSAKERVAVALNVPLLEKAIALRTQIAKIMGYPNHARLRAGPAHGQDPAARARLSRGSGAPSGA